MKTGVLQVIQVDNQIIFNSKLPRKRYLKYPVRCILPILHFDNVKLNLPEIFWN